MTAPTPTGPEHAAAARPLLELAALDVPGALQAMGSAPQGLASAQAARRLAQHGPNRIQGARRVPAWLQLLQQFTQLFSVILWCAAGLALLAGQGQPGHDMTRLALAIVAVIVASGVFAFVQERRVEHTLAALRQLLPARVATLRDGQAQELPTEQLVPGDVVLLRQGDVPPADCRVLESLALRVSLATMTGEAVAVARDARPATGTDPLRAGNLLLAGTAIAAGQARALVVATGSRTELGRIAQLSQAGPVLRSPLQQELARMSRVIAVLSVLIGAGLFALGAVLGVPVGQDAMFAIGVIVAMVPEGLQPTLTLSLVLAAQRMARRKVLVRHLPCVETLGAVSVICTDKTGTLTENRLQARELLLGLQPLQADALYPQPQDGDAVDLFAVAQWCHDLLATDAPRGQGLQPGDPLEVALVQMAQRVRPQPAPWRRVDEVPFDSDRMRQSVVCTTASGAVLLCKGALEAVLQRCSWLQQDGQVLALAPAARERIARAQDDMAARGLRVLAFAWRPLSAPAATADDEQGLVFLGLVGLEDPPRPEVAAAIARCQEAGIRVLMVTGDHPRTAEVTAERIGLVAPGTARVVTGEQLQAWSPAQLQQQLQGPPGLLFARVSAADKLRVVQALQAQQHIVAVTGDGVNDAPALRAAHIGVAMGRSGADVAQQAADIVLLDDHFASIVNGIEEGRAVFANIRKFLTYVLTHNMAELVPSLAFALGRVPLPLTPIQALAIDMGTDSLTAVGLGAEAPDPALMRQPPRPRSERLFNRAVALRAYLFLGLAEAAAALCAYFLVLFGGGWQFGQALAGSDPLYRQATTACMGAIVLMQAVNVFLCRSDRASVFGRPLLDNRWIAWGLVLEVALLLLIVYTPWGQALFGTAPLPAGVWAAMLPFPLALLLLEEARKSWVRSRRPA
jgi:calcium-translocating P-type ATPase